MALTQKETDELLNDEYGCPVDIFTRTEMQMMRMLVGDRVQNRFDMAVKASQSFDLQLLKGCVDELIRLDEMAMKINGILEVTA